jgi:DNA-binding CsgD family transcriptional regulator
MVNGIPPIMNGRIQRLTDRQKQCLRLVSHGLEVKEIARELGIGPAAVVERLRAARRMLDVESSRDAARLLAEHEHPKTYTRHVDTPQPVADLSYTMPQSPASEDVAGSDEPLRLQEVSGAFVVLDPRRAAGSRGWPWPWRSKGERSNDLTLSERLQASGALTIAIALGAAIILIAVMQLMDFLIHLSRHGG